MNRTASLTAAALLAALAAGALRAQEAPAGGTPPDAGQLVVTLNKAEPADAGCRLTFVLRNGLGTGLTDTAFIMAIFDAQGGFDRRVTFRFGGIGAGRSKVQQFDLVGRRCADISRLLVETAVECRAGDDSAPDCTAALTVGSDTAIALGL